MELSSAVLKGLQAAGSTVISDQVYKSLATQAVQDSITPADSSELKSKSRCINSVAAYTSGTSTQLEVFYLFGPLYYALKAFSP